MARASSGRPSASPSLAHRADYAIRTANVGTWDAATGVNSLQRQVTVGADGVVMAEPVAGAAARLPDTGVSSLAPAVLGGGVVALGALALLLARWRRNA